MRKTASQLAADKAAAKAAQLAEDAAVTDSTDTLEPLVIPANLGELSDDELDGLIEESNERAQLLNGDDGLEGLTDAEAVALIENAVEVGEKLDADKSRRVEEAEEAAQVLAETRERLANRLKGEDEDEDADAADDADDDDADADADADDDTADGKKAREPVAAAARTRRYARAKEHEPKGAPNVGNMLALRDLPGKFAGGANIDMRQAADLISDAWNRGHHHDGPRENTPLLRFTIDTPSDRVLGDDEIENWQKIAMATGKSREGRQALIASGGICAPPEPFYDLVVLAGQQTPVIDSITRFEAKRGAIRWMTSPQISDVTTSVGQVTAAADKLGGTNATKTSQVLPCPAQNTATIDAIYHSLTQGNMGHRTYPEFADAFTTLMMFQLFNVFNARSDEQSAFRGLFHNPLLWGALGISLALHVAVVYVPFLQNAFSTVDLSVGDWLFCSGVASSVLWLRELNKLVRRVITRNNT